MPVRKAILSLVPTPSVDDTRTGARYPRVLRLNSALKPPTPASTPGTEVLFAMGAIRCTSSSPAAILTPALAYVIAWLRIMKTCLCRGLSLRASRDAYHSAVRRKVHAVDPADVRSGPPVEASKPRISSVYSPNFWELII